MANWCKLYHGLLRSPKVMPLRAQARLLYVASISYSSEHLTDGSVPAFAVPMLQVEAGGATKADVAALVEQRLWHEAGDGFVIHDYLDHQEPAEQVKARREKDKARKAEQRNVQTDVHADATRNPAGRPNGVHAPVRGVDEMRSDEMKKTSSSSGSQQPKAKRLPADWSPSAPLIEWANREHPNVDLDHETAKFSDYWPAQGGARGRKVDWDLTWKNWIRNAAERLPKDQQSTRQDRSKRALDEWEARMAQADAEAGPRQIGDGAA